MDNCKTCGKEYHCCCNCIDDGCIEHGYCSEKCKLESAEYKEIKECITKIATILIRHGETKSLKTILDQYHIFELEINSILKSIENNYD